MNFNWIDFVFLAEELLNNQKEAHIRSSASRAYYGLFGIARNNKNLQNYEKADLHHKVISAYRDSKDENEKKVGRVLFQLRRSRNHADYHPHISFGANREKTEKLVAKAKYALELMGMLQQNNGV